MRDDYLESARFHTEVKQRQEQDTKIALHDETGRKQFEVESTTKRELDGVFELILWRYDFSGRVDANSSAIIRGIDMAEKVIAAMQAAIDHARIYLDESGGNLSTNAAPLRSEGRRYD